MKSARKTEKGLELTLETGESAFLARLPGRLRTAIAAGRSHQASDWLHPRLADDPTVDAGLQTLLGEELERERVACIDAFAADLAAVHDGDRILLDEEVCARWLAMLTDLRFMLAGELGIESDEDADRIVSERPHAPDVLLYAYLTSLQELIIREGFER